MLVVLVCALLAVSVCVVVPDGGWGGGYYGGGSGGRHLVAWGLRLDSAPPPPVASNLPPVAPGPNAVWYTVSLDINSIAINADGQKFVGSRARRNTAGEERLIIIVAEPVRLDHGIRRRKLIPRRTLLMGILNAFR